MKNVKEMSLCSFIFVKGHVVNYLCYTEINYKIFLTTLAYK